MSVWFLILKLLCSLIGYFKCNSKLLIKIIYIYIDVYRYVDYSQMTRFRQVNGGLEDRFQKTGFRCRKELKSYLTLLESFAGRPLWKAH